MKKCYLLVAGAFLCLAVNATNYFVDAVNGNNSYSGLSTAQAKATIQAASNLTNPGDTVFIMAGTYTGGGTILNITRPGIDGAPIVYTNYMGSLPKLKASETTYNIISIGAGVSYITINGLEVEGWGVNMSLAADTIPAKAQLTCPVSGSPSTSQNPLNKYNQNGIAGDSRSLGTTTGSTHVVISNNVVHDCGGGGIAMNQCDYITFDRNTVYNCAWYSIYGCSGITVNNHYNSDNNTTTYKNFVTNNVSYNNRMYVPWRAVCQITDGNGIILDVPQPDYAGKTLVANNISYNNGGSGIHSFRFNHTDIINNTAYFNSASPEINSGEIYARNANDVKIYNNILVSRPTETVTGVYTDTALVMDYNVYYGGSAVNAVGAHSLIQDPKFISASIDPLTANFHLQQGSFAVNNGDNSHTTPLDKDGNARPAASVVDMGAYETAYTGNLTDCNGSNVSKVLGNGGGTGEPGAGAYYGPYDTRAGNANYKSRHAIIYPQVLLNNSTVPANTYLTSLQFKRGVNVPGSSPAVVSTQTVPDNSIIKIYLRNEVDTFFTAAALDWNTILPSAANPSVLVYAGEAAPLIGNGGGWKTVTLQAPFYYSGTNLGVYIEYQQKGNVSGGTDVGWVYDNGGSQPLYNTALNTNRQYGTKATATTGTLSDNLTSNNERRAIITLGYCTSLLLPVKFQQFNGIKKGEQVYLNWLVSNEVNNAGFDVQRSANGSYFQTIGFVASTAFNGSGTTTYNFTDNRPLSGTGYYRLVQKDKDGKLNYSGIISIKNATTSVSILSLYPNPAHDYLNLLVSNTATNVAATISVQDMGGRVLSRSAKHLTGAFDNIPVNVSGLSAGSYMLVIESSSGERVVSRFVKQ